MCLLFLLYIDTLVIMFSAKRGGKHWTPVKAKAFISADCQEPLAWVYCCLLCSTMSHLSKGVHGQAAFLESMRCYGMDIQ